MNQLVPTAPPPAALNTALNSIEGGWPAGLANRRINVTNSFSYVNRRPGIGLDGQNVCRAAMARGGRPAFRRIRDALTRGAPWTGVAVLGVPASGKPVDGLERMLGSIGFRTRTWVPVGSNGAKKTDADAYVIAEGMRLAFRSDVTELVIVSADSDLRVLIEEAHALGKRAVVAHYAWQRAHVLDRMADEVVLLDERHLLAEVRP